MGGKMKLSKITIEKMAKSISDELLCMAGLKDAKKIAAQIKRYLATETTRRKNL